MFQKRPAPAAQQIQHIWGNFVLAGASGAHWGFSSADRIHGGFDPDALVDHGNGRYSAGWFVTSSGPGHYSPIEPYLAGYIAPEEVPKLRVAVNGRWPYEDGSPVRTSDGHPLFAAERRFRAADPPRPDVRRQCCGRRHFLSLTAPSEDLARSSECPTTIHRNGLQIPRALIRRMGHCGPHKHAGARMLRGTETAILTKGHGTPWHSQ
ncbi:MAG: hypothetical protein F4X72_07580 [Dehalococcoidia bacterium]|nr:hypothetical protein [Dehalococcoidia bacterium]